MLSLTPHHLRLSPYLSANQCSVMIFVSAPDLLIGLFQCPPKQSNNLLEDFHFLHQLLFHFIMHQVNAKSPLPKEREERPWVTLLRCLQLTADSGVQLPTLNAFACHKESFLLWLWFTRPSSDSDCTAERGRPLAGCFLFTG